MKVKVHITNRTVFLDRMVWANVDVPAVPRVDEFLYVSDETRAALEKMAVRRPNWEGAYADYVDPKVPDRVNFSGAIRVVDVAYFEGDPFVSIELGKEK